MATAKDGKCDFVLPIGGTNIPAKRKLVMCYNTGDESNDPSHSLNDTKHPNANKRAKRFAEAKPKPSTMKKLVPCVAPSVASSKEEKIAMLSNDFWESIRTYYLYLMEDDLTSACKETQEELSCTDAHSSPPSDVSCSWTCTYFIQRFNELHDNLHSLQDLAIKEPDKNTFLRKMETELAQLSEESKVLSDQAIFLEVRYPEMRDDIWKRRNILNNKWDALELSLWPQKKQARDGSMKRITAQMKNFRKWIREITQKLKDLAIKKDFTSYQVNEAYRKQQVVQKEIETRGREVTSLVKECEALEGATGESRVLRAARNLEKTWHRTWLSSLETQCLTEQILLNQGKSQSVRTSSDPDTDEGPSNKHRRLTTGSCCQILNKNSLNMESTNGDLQHVLVDGLNLTSGMRTEKSTREIGILCSVHRDVTQVNDKCIMVGTTGIAALKAEYGDDFTNFEIIQDVGYSSESSTHLSSDDINECIRIYSYSPSRKQFNAPLCENIRPGCIKLSSVADFSLTSICKGFGHSSLGSSSSHNDSGFGTVDSVVAFGEDTGDANESRHQSSPGLNSDCSEGISEDNIDFSVLSEKEDPNVFSVGDGFDTDDPGDTFHTRSSFTTSAQEFYKMTLVDSDHGDQEQSHAPETQQMAKGGSDVFAQGQPDHVDVPRGKLRGSSPKTNFSSPCNSIATSRGTNESPKGPPSSAARGAWRRSQNAPSFLDSDYSFPSDIECLPTKEVKDWPDSDFSDDSLLHRRYVNHLCSSPLQYSQHLKLIRRGRRRRMSTEVSDNSTKGKDLSSSPARNKTHRSTRVREWLKRCPSGKCTSIPFSGGRQTTPQHDSVSNDPPPHHHNPLPVTIDTSIDSSCDASGEYTTNESDADCSSCDDFLGSASFTFSGSGMGSVETVVPPEYQTYRRQEVSASSEAVAILLPPPPPSTPPLSHPTQCCQMWTTRRRLWSGTPKQQHPPIRIRSVSEGDLNGSCSRSQQNSFAHSNEGLCSFSSTPFSHPRFIVPSFNTPPGITKKQRHWRRSLPSVLRLESDQSSSDFRSHPKSSTSSSEVSHRNRGTRSRKRSSSSSHRSGRSGGAKDGRGAQQNIRPSLVATRRRHLSQIQTEEGSRGTLNKDWDGKVVAGTEKANIQIKVPDRTHILRSPENYLCLTQLEEQSTVSDQVWDGYQDMPYLSEAYSEPTVDEDAVRKLTEFGDDYCAAIGSHGLISKRGAKMDPLNSKTATSPKAASYTVLMTGPGSALERPSSHVDSDSDIEDLQDILAETIRALHFARSTLSYSQDGSALTQAEYAELLATCQTHLRCLQVICEHIQIDGKENSFSHEDLAQLHDLIQEWEVLQKTAVMNQQSEHSRGEKYQKALRDIDSLHHKMSELSSVSDLEPKDFSSLKDLKQRIEMIQMALSTLQETKELLLLVNLQVHGIVTESGDSASPLKDDIIELYQQWEDAYEQNGSQLTDLQLLYNKWQKYEKNYWKLSSRLQRERELLKMGKEPDTLTEEDERGVNLEDQLKELQMDAGFLECRLRGGMVWSSMADDLRHLHDELKELKWRQRHLGSGAAELASPGAPGVHSLYRPESAPKGEEDEKFEDACESRPGVPAQVSDVGHLGTEADKSPPSSGSRLWRVFRAALPIQLALVILYCLACALEPHCCDVLNNFNFSLSPQLRYVRGPPPV